jgi:hypothetical protein
MNEATRFRLRQGVSAGVFFIMAGGYGGVIDQLGNLWSSPGPDYVPEKGSERSIDFAEQPPVFGNTICLPESSPKNIAYKWRANDFDSWRGCFDGLSWC